MKKIVMLLIIFICIAVVFIAGINIVKPSLHFPFYAEQTTFYAKIKEVKEYNGITTLLVEGVESNDINHRGEFTFSVNETNVFWKDSMVSMSYLKVGQTINIVSYGAVQETYPARLTKVTKIIILDEKIN